MSCCTDWPRERDPTLHDVYAEMLLEPGWAGPDLSDVELLYIQGELLKNKKFSYRWGFAPGQKTRPADAIRQNRLEGPVGRPNSDREARGGLAEGGRPDREREEQIGFLAGPVQMEGTRRDR